MTKLMTRSRMLYLTVPVSLMAFAFFGARFSRAGYETAEYTVIESDGAFEVRQYPDLMLASTEMLPRAQGDNGSFMRLFRYISGRNQDEKKVSMTTPVFMKQPNDAAKGQMGFVIPKDVVASGVPEPSASDVQIRERKGGEFAVIRFSGKLDEKSAIAAEAKLRKWIESKGYTADKSSESAGYDPPFIPGPLRRNEILIRLQQPVSTPTATTAAKLPN